MPKNKRRTIKDRKESISSRPKKRNRLNPLQGELDRPLSKSLKESLAVGAALAGPGKVLKPIKKFISKALPAQKGTKIARNRSTRTNKANADLKAGKITEAQRLAKFKTASKLEKAALARKAKGVGPARVKKAMKDIRLPVQGIPKKAGLKSQLEDAFSPASMAAGVAKRKAARIAKEAAQKAARAAKRKTKK
jgi:hypothetical protein